MTEDAPDFASWLPVIGKSLAYLCLADAIRHDPDRFKETLPKVDFLQALGLSHEDASVAAGSTPGSVRVLKFNRDKKAKNGKAGSKKAHRLKR
ncbi:MAG: hypothetical protein JOY90_36330 [Bradyrhizobium sp.]|uniref:hypothetical protein n=1 Tax=Bradyrhizobium sp. TaxID=376 RepID=UPI001DDAE956|nr:hypothetical protein [Bradyrhizobium sp.]MBV9565880.1 hypothetical protein [Bradyrhizobium sp.]